jgi:phosphatidylglycerol:prolipoprotein diacylglycerol transferase
MRLIESFIYWNVSPVIVEFPGTISLTWYGVMWALGLIISRQAGLYIFLKENRYTANLPDLFLLIVIPALIGARLGHFLFYDLHAMLANPIVVLMPPFHGLSSDGGVLGILIGVYGWCRRNNADYLFVIDRLAIVACSAGACIRLGNLMNSEIIGLPATVPWAFIFVKVDLVPRHPAQLYECLFYVLLFLLMVYVWSRHAHQLRSGMLLGIILVLLWSFRFFVESLKENQSLFENHLWLNMGQLLSIPYIVAGIILIAWRRSAPHTKNN